MVNDTPVDASRRPAIPPVPARRTRLLLYGQIAGVVVAVAAVVVASVWPRADQPAGPATTATVTATVTVAPPRPRGTDLPAFEQRQVAVNRAMFSAPLATFATPWLPWLSGCSSSRKPAGPKLRDGERTRVVCWYGSIAVYFVEYASTADRDRYRDQAAESSRTATGLAPGAVGPVEKTGTSGLTRGTYVEYAYPSDTAAPPRTVAGLWWDGGAPAPVAVYLLGYWQDDLGQSWEPLREVWRRNS
ncbi:hypothetical protein [Micromonospora echinofusca]|uniref:DUF4178 domain-containing protein n=1 Tax=Micromonospora echinofusca TaxID=47858 RepID=A0ABS3VRY9_MICEH|nr:hypothetical protein [Micromonospora echinofusca]MBO4207314.1 hypothetical protein [Micromonospora echinofusca]